MRRFLLVFLLSLLTPGSLAQVPFWEPVSDGLAVPYSPGVPSLAQGPDGTIVAGFSEADGFARSSDGGITWEAVPDPKPPQVTDLSADPDGGFLAAGYDDVYRSDDGLTWSVTLPADWRTPASAVIALPGEVALVGWGRLSQRTGSLLRSADDGETWAVVHETGFPFAFTLGPDGALFASTTAGIARSDDGGLTWTEQPGLVWTTTPVLFAADGAAYVGVGDYFDDSPAGAVYRSDDGAATWQPVLVPEGADYFRALAQLPDGRILAAASTTVPEERLHVYSTGSGWSPVPEVGVSVGDIAVLGEAAGAPVLLGSSRGLHRSEGDLSEWTEVGAFEHFLPIHGFAESEGDLVAYAVDRVGFEGPPFQGLVFRRSGGGAWTAAASTTEPRMLHFDALPSGRLVVVGDGGTEVGYSDDGGDTWTYDGFTGRGFIQDFVATSAGTLVVATAFEQGEAIFSDLYRSDDSGASWARTASGTLPVFALAETPRGLLAAGGSWFGESALLLRSTDEGQTWEGVPLPPDVPTVYALTATADAYFLGDNDGVWRSAGGEAWERVLETEGGVAAMEAGPEGDVFVAGFPSGSWPGVYRSGDGGETWTLEEGGIGGHGVSSLFVASDGHLYAGTGHVYYASGKYGVYRSARPIGTSVEGALGEARALSLAAPHPNPSAGRVAFTFSTTGTGPVTLEVVDVLGRHVALLVEETLPAGTHEASWDATGAAAGVYFGVLRVDDRVLARPFTRVR